MASRGGAYFPYLENFISQKPLDRLQYNLARMVLMSPSTKIAQAVMLRQKHVRQGVGGGAYFPYISI